MVFHSVFQEQSQSVHSRKWGQTAVHSVNGNAGETPVPALSNSFPRSARLLKPADFNRVFRKNAASTDRYFRILARPNHQHRSRLGLAVSKKIDKRAVGRNRIKRIVRESFRQNFGKSQDPVGLDFVVLPRAACATICNQEMSSSLEKHWKRLRRRLTPQTANDDSNITESPSG